MASVKDKKLLKRHTHEIDSAFKFQDHNGWKSTVKLTMALTTGHMEGFEESDSRYFVYTYLNLINLILPNIYAKQPYVKATAKVPRFFKKGKEGKYQSVDGERASNILSAALNDAFIQLDVEEEHKKALQDAMTHGWGIIKVGTKKKTVSELSNESQSKILFCQRICPIDLGYDPMSTDPDNAAFLVHRHISTKEQLRNDSDIPKTAIDNLQIQALAEGTKAKEKKEEVADSDDEEVMPIELYEHHDQINNRITLYGRGDNEYIKLKAKDNPHDLEGSHFIKLRFTGDNDEWSGISMLRAVQDQALAVNDMVDLMVKHFKRFPGVIVTEEGVISPSEMDKWENMEQGDFLIANDTAKVEFKSPTSMGQEYFSGLITFNQIIDRVHGIPDFQRGGSKTRKTATENLLESGDANVRRDFFARIVEKFVIRTSNKIVGLIQQYYDEDEIVKLTGEFTEWPSFSKADIQGEYLLELDITDMVKFTQAQAQGIANVMQILGQNQEAMAYFSKEVDMPKLVNVMMKGFGVDLTAMKKSKPLIREEYDPYAENAAAKAGKRLPDPLPHEPHQHHTEVHSPAIKEFELLGQKEQAYELTRHNDMHNWIAQKSGQSAPASPSAVPSQAGQPGLEQLMAQSQQATPGQPPEGPPGVASEPMPPKEGV